MKIRKIIKSMVFLIVVVFVVSGPYIFETFKDNLGKVPEKEEESFKGVIVLWDYPYFNKENGTRYGWITKKIKAFEKENKGVYIDFKPLSRDNAVVEVETALKVGALPDIVPVAGEVVIQKLGMLEPLNDYIDNNILNEYLNGIMESVTYKEKIYGIPKLIDLHIMIMNKYELESMGFDLVQKPGMKAEDFLSFAEEVYLQTGKPLTVEKESRLSMAWLANDQEQLEEIQYKTGMAYKSNIIKEIENNNIAIGACSTMDLAKLNYNMGGELDYKWMNFYAHQKNIYGECLSYGIVKQDDKKKLKMCIKFIDFLTDNEEQMVLKQYNAFSVKKSQQLYSQESDMGQLEKFLRSANKKFTNTLTKEQKSDFINMYHKE